MMAEASPTAVAPRSADAERLLELAARKSAQGRETLYRTLWDFFEQRSGMLTQAERDLMTDILRQLSREIEMTIRVELSKRLAAQPGACRELARILADDQIEVAFPILMESRVLQDVDLIEIVRERTQQHRLAVAMRADISGDVCTALVDCADDEVTVAMLRNTSAQIGAGLYERLSEQSRGSEILQEPLLGRPDLPAAVARRMFAWVSAALRHFIVGRFQLDTDAIDDTISQSLTATSQVAVEEPLTSPAETMVERLAREGKLTSDFLVKALRRGEIAAFEAGFAKLAGIRLQLAKRIIYEPGGEAFAIACIAGSIDRRSCLKIFELTRKAHEMPLSEAIAQADALGTFFDTTSREAAEVVVRKWRRDPEYLAALKQIGVA